MTAGRTPASPTADALHYLSLSELSAMLRARTLSPVEVTRAQLERIEALDPDLGSYALVLPEQAMEEARRAEREIAAGRHRGPLHGVPLGVKDLLWTRGVRTAAGTTLHRSFRPDRDATAVARLREAGAVILGKQQMTEGAYSDHHPWITPPRNPWDPALWPGISSSGPAVATAPWPRTRADRSAGPAPRPASPASSRPGDGSAASAPSPWRRPWSTSDRSPGAPATPLSSSPPSPGPTTWIRPRSPRRCPTSPAAPRWGR